MTRAVSRKPKCTIFALDGFAVDLRHGPVKPRCHRSALPLDLGRALVVHPIELAGQIGSSHPMAVPEVSGFWP